MEILLKTALKPKLNKTFNTYKVKSLKILNDIFIGYMISFCIGKHFTDKDNTEYPSPIID